MIPDCTNASDGPIPLFVDAASPSLPAGGRLRLTATARDPGPHHAWVNGEPLLATVTFNEPKHGEWDGVSFAPVTMVEAASPIGGLVEVHWEHEGECRRQLLALAPGITADLGKGATPLAAPSGARCGIFVASDGVKWDGAFGEHRTGVPFPLHLGTTLQGETYIFAQATRPNGEFVNIGFYIAPLLPGLYEFSYDTTTGRFRVRLDPTYANGTASCTGAPTYGPLIP